MIIAVSLLKDGVDNAVLSLQSIYYENAKLNATICLEDTLLRMKKEEEYTREVSYQISENQSCNTELTWYTPQQTGVGTVETLVDLKVTGISKNFSRSFNYEAKVKKFDINDVDGSLNYTNNIDIISIEEINT